MLCMISLALNYGDLPFVEYAQLVRSMFKMPQLAQHNSKICWATWHRLSQIKYLFLYDNILFFFLELIMTGLCKVPLAIFNFLGPFTSSYILDTSAINVLTLKRKTNLDRKYGQFMHGVFSYLQVVRICMLELFQIIFFITLPHEL